MERLWEILDYSRPIRWARLLLARRHGRAATVDGRLDVVTTVAVTNWIFQRVLGVNHSCRFPVNFTSRIARPDMLTYGTGVVASLAGNGGIYIQAHNGVKIGDDVLIAPGVRIVSANHVPGERRAWTSCRPIEIHNRAWLGANSVILPGVHIGPDAIVGAGAVVSHDVPAGRTVVGVPARALDANANCADGSSVQSGTATVDAGRDERDL